AGAPRRRVPRPDLGGEWGEELRRVELGSFARRAARGRGARRRGRPPFALSRAVVRVARARGRDGGAARAEEAREDVSPGRGLVVEPQAEAAAAEDRHEADAHLFHARRAELLVGALSLLGF